MEAVVMGNSSTAQQNDKAKTNRAQNGDYPMENIMAIQKLSLPQVQSQSVQTPESNLTRENITEKEENTHDELDVAQSENHLLLEEETEYSKSVVNTEETEDLITSESSKAQTSGGLKLSNNLPGRFNCHTSTMAHAYFMWHLSKYCCSANEPYWEEKRIEAEELFDDCLNYLECSDVLTDYANKLWQSSLLGNNPVFLLASAESDETIVRQDSLNGCDPLLSGTYVNDVSNNTLAMDALPAHCVSQSESEEEAIKGEFSWDSQTDMVIVVGHQEDETPNMKNKERCKLASAAAAIQNDKAGIEEEDKGNTFKGKEPIHGIQSNTFVELFPINALGISVKAMTEEPVEYSIITTCLEEQSQKQGLDDDTFALSTINSPEIPTESCKEALNQCCTNKSPDQKANETESFSLPNEGEYREQQDLLELTDLFIKETDTNCNSPTSSCEENQDLPDNAALTSIKHHKPDDFICENVDLSSGLVETADTDIFTTFQETSDIVGNKCNKKNQIEKPIQEIDETKNITKDVLVCPVHKLQNARKENCTDCMGDKFYQILGQPCKDNKEGTGENVPSDHFSAMKCKKQDSLDDGYHSLGMSCDQYYVDTKNQEDQKRMMTERENYKKNSIEDCSIDKVCRKSVETTNKLSINQLDNTKLQDINQMENTNKQDDVSGGLDTPANMDMINDKVLLTTCGQAKSLGLPNHNGSDTLALDSKGKQFNKNKPKQHAKGEPSKRKVFEHSSQNKKNCTLISGADQLKTKLENNQKNTFKKPLSFQNDKLKSTINQELPVETNTALHDKITERKGALSLNATEHILNSMEPLNVCKNTGGVNLKEESIKNVQHPTSSVECKLSSSDSSHSGSTENKMSKKKLKVQGKEYIKMSKCSEKDKLLGEEILVVKEENRDKKESKTEAAAVKDNKKAPCLLHSIQAEMFPDNSGNIKLQCYFGDIHADSTVTWTKDSKLLARIHRSSKDDSPVSLAIVQTSKQDQGLYHCSLKNMYGKVSAEFHLTSEVLDKLIHYQDFEGGEEIEFNQLLFREDFISDMYFGGNLHGKIATEELHFGEGVHRKAFRSKVMCGLLPVFNPGHICVLKVHNAIAYGTKNNDELVQRNYKLAVQECYVQNTAREYAKIYAAEAELLEDFGMVPEIIPVFLVHRPANNIPYATVEEELIGEFVKYSIRDGKEINFLRKDSEAGQKCCTFQHWVYEKTSGNLLVTDMQGVGMKLTDVGIATIAKGYKGFKGNCSVSFIDQFKALHQCNKYCEILGLKSLKPQKQKKPTTSKEKAQPVPPTTKKSKHVTKAKNKT